MKLLLIETATPTCSVAISRDPGILGEREEVGQRVHGKKLLPFVKELSQETGIALSELDGIAVSKGPGSYTGLRIGVASAKSLCYSLDLPLAGVNTLQGMAYQAYEQVKDDQAFYCPLLDARRLEAYYAVFDANMAFKRETRAEVMDQHTLGTMLDQSPIYFFGDAMEKSAPYLQDHENARFIHNIAPKAGHLKEQAEAMLKNGNTENLALFEPFYLKDFVAQQSKKIEKVLNS